MPRLSLLSLSAILALTAPLLRADILIDPFTDFQYTAISGGPVGFQSSWDAISAGSILGSEREIYIERTSANSGSISMDVDGSFTGALAYASSPATRGRGIIVYDGADTNGAIDYTGLGGIDLTDAGQYLGVALSTTSDLGATVRFTIYTDATHYSTFTNSILADPTFTFQSYFTRFADFSAAGVDGGADFSNVGAITVELDGTSTPGTDIGIDYFAATVPEPSGAMLIFFSGMMLMFRGRRHSRR